MIPLLGLASASILAFLSASTAKTSSTWRSTEVVVARDPGLKDWLEAPVAEELQTVLS